MGQLVVEDVGYLFQTLDQTGKGQLIAADVGQQCEWWQGLRVTDLRRKLVVV